MRPLRRTSGDLGTARAGRRPGTSGRHRGRRLGAGACLAFRFCLALGACAALAACSDGDGDRTIDTAVRVGTVLAVDEVAPAIAALEAARGGAQRYTEINANADGVSLFVAVDEGHEVAYLYADGVLGPPDPPVPLTGAPFTLDGVDRHLAPELVRRTQQQLPGAEVTALALVQPPDVGLVWALKSRSPRGGVLNVLYSPTGQLLSVAPGSPDSPGTNPGGGIDGG